MGGIFSLLEKKSSTEAFIDFHNAPPPTDPTELEVYNDMCEIINECRVHLERVKSFKNGGPAQVKASMAKPTDLNLLAEAFVAIVPNAIYIKEFKDFSVKIASIVPRLMEVLMAPDSSGVCERQGLATQLADLLDFSLQFDMAKMMNSAIMNDFSQYKRSIGRLRDHPAATIKEAETNDISMFIAIHIPMTTTLAIEFKKCFDERREAVTCLSGLANICCEMANNEKTSLMDGEVSVDYILRVMSGAVILYDHVDPAGVFCKSSPINITKCVKVLKKRKSQGLINSIRYSTATFGKESTPAAIKRLIEDP